MSSIGSFNPLPHAEGDRVHEIVGVRKHVSIHSLTQRETLLGIPITIPIVGFNPLPHAEGDNTRLDGAQVDITFQSTPSRRGRLGFFDSVINPGGVSIHSLTQRETSVADRF